MISRYSDNWEPPDDAPVCERPYAVLHEDYAGTDYDQYARHIKYHCVTPEAARGLAAECTADGQGEYVVVDIRTDKVVGR